MLAQPQLEVDWVSRVLFESPWLAVVVLALVWMSMRIVGRRTNHKPLTRASWAPLVLIVALVVTSMMVTTKREKLVQALDALLLAVEDADTAGFRAIVPEDAEALFPPGRGAETYTRAMVERRLKDAKVRDLLLLDVQETILKQYPDDGVTVIRLRAQGNVAGIAGVQVYEWAIRWRYENGRWLAYHFECLEIGFDIGLGGG